MLEFSDGMKFDTSGELRLTHRSDGWYVVGRGMLCPVRDREEGEDRIARITAKEDKDARDRR